MTTTFTINGRDIHTDQGDANTFKGFGYLNCNNSSRLLLDYKWQQPEAYQAVLHILFGGPHPLMRMLKVELGADANTSSGTEPSPKRSAVEPADVRRGVGFQLIADAKKIQPDLMTSILRWAEPGWLKADWRNVRTDDPDARVPEAAFEPMYQYYKQTIIAAWQTYGYLFDYIDPDRNETRHPMVRFIKWFAQRLRTDNEGFPEGFPVAQYQAIKLIAADQNTDTNFGDMMLADPALRAAVPAVGYHYRTSDGDNQPFTQLADTYHHEVWYSEGVGPMTAGRLRQQDTRGIGIGGTQSALDIANRLIKSCAQSRRSFYIFQPALAGFYPGVRYAHKELIVAQTPWSGYYQVDNIGLQVMKHFSDFAVAGWNRQTNGQSWRYITSATASAAAGTENLSQPAGAPSYMTLAAPDGADVSTIFVNDTDQKQTYTVILTDLPAAHKPFNIWETRGTDAPEEDYDAHVKQLIGTAPVTDGRYTVTIKPHAVVTVTTLDRSADPAVVYHRLTAAAADTPLYEDPHHGILFQDDYSYADMPAAYLADRGGAPRYTTDLGGAFEVAGGKLVQQITEAERALDWEYSCPPNFTIGDDHWENYSVRLGFAFDLTTQQNSTDGNFIALGIREQNDFDGDVMAAPYGLRLTTAGHYEFWDQGRIVQQHWQGDFDPTTDHELQITGNANLITVQLDGQEIVRYLATEQPALSGRVKVGTGYYHTAITNLIVQQVPGQVTMSTTRWDDLDPRLTFVGNWQREANRDSKNWERSLSVGQASAQTPTSVQFAFAGTGFVLIGGGNRDALLNIYVDGGPVQILATPLPTAEKQPNLMVPGLPAARHEVTVEVARGTYTLDAVEFITEESASAND